MRDDHVLGDGGEAHTAQRTRAHKRDIEQFPADPQFENLRAAIMSTVLMPILLPAILSKPLSTALTKLPMAWAKASPSVRRPSATISAMVANYTGRRVLAP